MYLHWIFWKLCTSELIPKPYAWAALITTACNSLQFISIHEAARSTFHSHSMVIFMFILKCGFYVHPKDVGLDLFFFFLNSVLVVSWRLQDTSVKATVVVTCLKGSLCTPISPRAAVSRLSFWLVKMSLADKSLPVARRVTSNN